MSPTLVLGGPRRDEAALPDLHEPEGTRATDTANQIQPDASRGAPRTVLWFRSPTRSTCAGEARLRSCALGMFRINLDSEPSAPERKGVRGGRDGDAPSPYIPPSLYASTSTQDERRDEARIIFEQKHLKIFCGQGAWSPGETSQTGRRCSTTPARHPVARRAFCFHPH